MAEGGGSVARGPLVTPVRVLIVLALAVVAIGLGVGLGQNTTVNYPAAEPAGVVYATAASATLTIPALGCAALNADAGGVASAAAAALVAGVQQSAPNLAVSASLYSCSGTQAVGAATCAAVAAAVAAGASGSSTAVFAVTCTDGTGTCGAALIAGLRNNVYLAAGYNSAGFAPTFSLIYTCAAANYDPSIAAANQPLPILSAVIVASKSITPSSSVSPSVSVTSSVSKSVSVTPSSSLCVGDEGGPPPLHPIAAAAGLFRAAAPSPPSSHPPAHAGR
jgi:hypothetical protein